MSKNLHVSVLLDYYGNLLTEKQRDLAELYYNDDLSLGEIAEITNITRQGVHDSIKRTEAVLLEYEEKIGLQQKTDDIIGLLEKVSKRIQRLQDTCQKTNSSSLVMDELVKLEKLVTNCLKDYE